MLQPRQQCTGLRIHKGLDFHNRGDGLAHLAKELQAHGTRVRVRAVQDKACRRDDAVATFLLNAGQAAQEFVGDILAKSGLSECTADMTIAW